MDKRQTFHNDLKKFQDYAYDNPVLPKRYVYVLTNLCNLACDFCFQHRTKQKGALNSNEWIKFLGDLPDNSRITLTGGEPLTIKNFKDALSLVESKISQ